MSLFIRYQVEPEVKNDPTSTPTIYGFSRRYSAYLPEFSGMPQYHGNEYPPVEDIDGGRVNMIGA